MVDMTSGLDGSWDKPSVTAELLRMGESVYLSYLGKNNHRAVVTDSRDAGEQHRVLVMFAECFNVLCSLCLFMYQCFYDGKIACQTVLLRIRECETSKEFHSSCTEQIAVVTVLYSIPKKDRMDLVLVSGDLLS